MKGTHPDIKRSYKVSDHSVEDHPFDSLENRSSSHEVATKSLRVRIKEDDARSCSYSGYDPRSNKDKGDTSIRTNLEEDIHNSEYHSGDPEVATIYNSDKDVTTAHIRIDEECQTMESTKLSSNRWEESYCEIEVDRSNEYHQMETEKMSTTRLLSKLSKGIISTQKSTMSNEIRSEVRKASSGGSTIKEFSHINETATFGEITDEITKDIGNKTFRHEKFKAHE